MFIYITKARIKSIIYKKDTQMKLSKLFAPFNPLLRQEKIRTTTLSIKDGVVYLNLIGEHCFSEDEVAQQIKIGDIADLSESLKILHALNDVGDFEEIFFGVNTSDKTLEASIKNLGAGTRVFLTFAEVFQQMEKKGKHWLNGLSINPFGLIGWRKN